MIGRKSSIMIGRKSKNQDWCLNLPKNAIFSKYRRFGKTVVKKVVGSYWVYLHHIAVARGCLAVPTSGSLPESIQVVAGEKIQQIAQQQCVTIVLEECLVERDPMPNSLANLLGKRKLLEVENTIFYGGQN